MRMYRKHSSIGHLHADPEPDGTTTTPPGDAAAGFFATATEKDDVMTEALKPPAHFAASTGWSGRRTLADDHAVWKLIGAWIATRQRGDAALIRPFAIATEAERVVADAEALITHGGGPLRTGAELDVVATARFSTDGRTLREIDIRLDGRVEKPGHEPEKVVSRLVIAEAVADGDMWKIMHLLDDAARGLMHNADFLRFIEQQKAAATER